MQAWTSEQYILCIWIVNFSMNFLLFILAYYTHIHMGVCIHLYIFSTEVTKSHHYSKSAVSPCLIYVHIFVLLQPRALQCMLVFKHRMHSNQLEKKGLILVCFASLTVKKLVILCRTESVTEMAVFYSVLSLWLGCFVYIFTLPVLGVLLQGFWKGLTASAGNSHVSSNARRSLEVGKHVLM